MTREQKIASVKELAAILPEEYGKKVLDDARVTFIREDVREKHESHDELAILRKAVAYLFELIATLHEGEIDNEEFAKYNAGIEAIKKNITEAMYEDTEI